MEMFIDGTSLGSLKVLEVYEYYDGPRLFASVNDTGSVFLVLWIRSTSTTDEYYVQPMSFHRFRAMREGEISLRDVFIRGEGEHTTALAQTGQRPPALNRKAVCLVIPRGVPGGQITSAPPGHMASVRPTSECVIQDGLLRHGKIARNPPASHGTSRASVPAVRQHFRIDVYYGEGEGIHQLCTRGPRIC
jgi:hypothetical protein